MTDDGARFHYRCCLFCSLERSDLLFRSCNIYYFFASYLVYGNAVCGVYFYCVACILPKKQQNRWLGLQ